MKIKKLLYFILFVFVIILSGCGQDSSPKNLWNDYIKAMNEKSIEKVAAVYYKEGTNDYNRFIEDNTAEEYFIFTSLKTKLFSTYIENNRYFVADVTLEIDGTENEFEVYFVRSLGGPWNFITEVNLNTSNSENLGNEPDAAYFNGVIKNDNSFDYKYVYAGQAGVEGPNDYVKIVYPNKNSKVITIPDMIDNVPVTVIGDFAFFDYFRIFSVTFSKSKLEQITLPSGLKMIDEYAFYQTKNLKQIELPASLQQVKTYAFASSGIEKLVINVDDEAAYSELQQKTGKDTMTINGDRVVYVGAGANSYSLLGYPADQVKWSVDDTTIATITESGNLSRVAPGTVTVKATLKEPSDGSVYSTAKVEVKAAGDKLVQSSIPADPAFFRFLFSLNKVNFVGESIAQPGMSPSAFWTTSDSNVAVVEGNRLKMVGPGTVTIRAAAQANPNNIAEATITVKELSERFVDTEFSYESFEFTGARDMFKGDYIKLIAEGFNESQIEWTSLDNTIATVGRYNGVVTALGVGSVTIRGHRTDDPSIVSMVTIVIKEPIKGVEFADYALDRLNSLEELYINSINPYSITFNGTLKLKEDVIIYVPAQNINTYKTVFSKYANNIQPMP